MSPTVMTQIAVFGLINKSDFGIKQLLQFVVGTRETSGMVGVWLGDSVSLQLSSFCMLSSELRCDDDKRLFTKSCTSYVGSSGDDVVVS